MVATIMIVTNKEKSYCTLLYVLIDRVWYRKMLKRESLLQKISNDEYERFMCDSMMCINMNEMYVTQKH